MQTIEMSKARRGIATLWYVSSAVLLLLVVAQTMANKFGDKWPEVWYWFVPTWLPTVSLITGVIAANALHIGVPEKIVRLFVYKLCFWSSAAYLLLVSISLVGSVFTSAPIALMKMSTTWLAPVQGVVALTLGVFFVSKDERGTA